MAQRLAATINPDGNFSDVDRARKRGVVIGRQHTDGMSPITGWLNPELRASLDAVLGKLAAPGMCNPEDQSPRVDGDPDPEVAGRDRRTTAQRTHDALLAMCRSILASGELGSHHGLPVTIIVSTTLDHLEKGTGQAVTGAGTLLPMRDVIRMAAHAYHYLAVFDRHSECPLYLGRTRRTASASQRIMLHAHDRGCTFPGCTVPGYRCEVDHITDWANGGPTDIDDLTFRLRNTPQTQNPRRLDRPAQVVGRPHRMDPAPATRTAQRRQRLPPPRTIPPRGGVVRRPLRRTPFWLIGGAQAILVDDPPKTVGHRAIG